MWLLLCRVLAMCSIQGLWLFCGVLHAQEIQETQDKTPGLARWKGDSYPEFCAHFGLGKAMPGGLLRYQHRVDGEVVEVTLADWIQILTIGIVENDGTVNRSEERIASVLSVRPIAQWDGGPREARTELASWINKSHLPFQKRFGCGRLFNDVPRTYYYEISGLQIIVVVGSGEVIRAIQWLDTDTPQWASIKSDTKSASPQ